MAAALMPFTKIFKKCSILVNNPVCKELFLVIKKMTLYCVNIKNKSIRKVKSPLLMYDAEVKYSSDGKYFVIIEYCKDIYVFNSNTLELVRSFYLKLRNDNNNHIESSEISQFIIYNEFLICIVNYIIEDYTTYEDFGQDIFKEGIEVYNITTGELVTNKMNISICRLQIINNNIYCSINEQPYKIYQLTLELDLLELSYIITNLCNYINMKNELISFSFIKNNNEYFLYKTITTDKIETVKIDLNFKLTCEPTIYNMMYTPDNKYFLVGLKFNNFTRILYFNSSINTFLFSNDIKTNYSFYILDDYRIVYDKKGTIYTIDNPLIKMLHFTKACEQNSKYYLPDELRNKILLSF